MTEPDVTLRPRRRTTLLVATWVAGIVSAALVDVPVCKWVYNTRPLRPGDVSPTGWVAYPGPKPINYKRERAPDGTVYVVDEAGNRRVANPEARKFSLLKRVLRWQGNYLYIMVLAGLLTVLHPRRWRAGGLMLLAGAVASFFPFILKWAVGRTRPYRGVSSWEFHPFPGGLPGLFENAELTFPSGDAALAFASAATLRLLLPGRWWVWIFYLTALVTAAQRVLENAHHVSDVTVGALVGIASAHLTAWGWGQFIEQRDRPLPVAGQ